MKDKLIEILDLAPDATEVQIIDAVAALQTEAKAKAITNAREKKIQKKISESGNALNREQAAMAIDHQEESDARRKAKN
jgi:hypothetical protein